MKRILEKIQRITYVISEAEIVKLVRSQADKLVVENGGHGPTFSPGTTIERMECGGYRICTEYIEESP